MAAVGFGDAPRAAHGRAEVPSTWEHTVYVTVIRVEALRGRGGSCSGCWLCLDLFGPTVTRPRSLELCLLCVSVSLSLLALSVSA